MSAASVCYSQKLDCYVGRYQDPSTKVWKTKVIPWHVMTEEDARKWLSDFLAAGLIPSGEVSR